MDTITDKDWFKPDQEIQKATLIQTRNIKVILLVILIVESLKLGLMLGQPFVVLFGGK